MEIKSLDELIEKLAIDVSFYTGKKITEYLIGDALMILYGDKYGIIHPVNYCDIEISFEEALKSLTEFDFDIFLKPVQIDFEFDEGELFGTKTKIKAAGLQVLIHKYDKDPFPSNPHGHICDQNLKIDLGNGKCYRNRNFIRRIRKKELLELREKARVGYKGNLPPLDI